MYYALEDKRERFNEDLVYLMYETQEREDRRFELLSKIVSQGLGDGTNNRTAVGEQISTPVMQNFIIQF